MPVKHLRGDQTSCDMAVLEAIEQTITPHTRLVVLSHLLWNTGQIMPIAVAPNGCGNTQNILSCWWMQPRVLGKSPWRRLLQHQTSIPNATSGLVARGLGGVACSNVVEAGQPTIIGWRSLRDESKADLSGIDCFHRDSRRFEVATSCVPLMAGLRRSLNLRGAGGNLPRAMQRIQRLSGTLCKR